VVKQNVKGVLDRLLFRIEDPQKGIEIHIFYDSKSVFKIYYFVETGESKGKVMSWLDFKKEYKI
jgi:hypothetical protein